VVTLFGNEPVKVEYRWDEDEVTFFEAETSVTAPEGNHTLNFRVVDLFGHWSDWSDILISVDMTPPDLIIRTDPEIPDGNDGWFITDPTIILESSELLNYTFYSIDGGDAEEYFLPFRVEEGAHFVTFTATDLAGNDNDAGLTLMIDLTAPSSVISISDDPDGFNDYYITVPELELSCPDEPEAGVEFKWDDGEWVEYEAPIYPEEGIHTLYYRGMDLSGNYEPAHDQIFKVDTAPPMIELNVDPVEPGGSNGFYISTPIINISKNEGEAYYILGGVNDEIDWTTSTKLVNGFVIPEGEWVLFVKTIDLAGNEANIGPTQFYVDLTPPKFNFEVGPSTPNGNSGWYTTAPTIKLTSESPDTTMYLYDADADEWILVDQKITIEDGEHQLRFKAVDIAGNVVYDETEWLKIDQVAPELTILAPQKNEVVNEPVIIEWAGGDETSGIVQYKLKLDNGIWSDMEDSTSLEITVLQDGVHEIHLKAFDDAGNTVTITRTFEFQSSEVNDDNNDQDKDDRVDPKSDSDSGDGNDGLAPGIIAGILVLVLIIIIVVSIGLYVHLKNKHEELELLAEMDEMSMVAPNQVPAVRQTYNAYLLPMAQPLSTKNYMFPGPQEQAGSNANSNFIKSPPHQNQNIGTGVGAQSSPSSVPPQTPTPRPTISTPPTPRVIWRPAPVPRPKIIKSQEQHIKNFTTDPPQPKIKVKPGNRIKELSDELATNNKP
jgi:hypothetical protein